MNNIYIFCDGGLGNRLNSLVGGILTSKILNLSPVIVWPKTNWCSCPFNKLFSTSFKILEKKIDELFEQDLNANFILHFNYSKYDILNLFNHSINNLNEIKNSDKDVYYSHDSIPEYFNESEILSVLNDLKINEDIMNQVNTFLKKHNLSNYMGLHFRKTDSLIDNRDDYFLSMVSENQNKFFVCSDDLETENKFLQYPNVVTYKKNSYVEKFVPYGNWDHQFRTESGHFFNFNINRTESSVIFGFIDLLLLSKTNIITNTSSSFLSFAKYYNKLNKK